MTAQEVEQDVYMGIGLSIIKSNFRNISDIENLLKLPLKLSLIDIKKCNL